MKECNVLDPAKADAGYWGMDFSSRTTRWMLISGVTLVAACAAIPIHNRIYQFGFFAGIVLAWCGLFSKAGRSRKTAVLLTAIPLIAMLPFMLPGKPLDRGKLRADYVARMRAFDGTRYVWGGESSLGIDCSGLPRRALRDALWSEGWNHANGLAFRLWLDQWWHDASALAMSQGYRGATRSLGMSAPLWKFDESKLLPGDLAIKGGGCHVLAFLGNHQWIEADPTLGKVHTFTSTPDDGVWYANMTLHRWVICDYP